LKKKLLIISDDPNLTSGLGRITREISTRFLERFEVSVAAWHHVSVRHSFPFFIYSLEKRGGKTGSDLLLALTDFNPEIILFISDIWDFFPISRVLSEYKEKKYGIKVVGWITVDGECLHSSWAQAFHFMDGVATFSHFGRKEIKQISNVQAEVIYPGVDHGIFHQREMQVKTKAGLAFDPKNTFLILSITQNTDRKNIPLLLETFSEFSKEKKDAFLFLGTDPNDPLGYDLWDMIKQLGMGRQMAVAREVVPVGGVPDKKLAFLYNLAVVFVSNSIGEGFGMPIIEAMACGIPVIATNYSSPPELLGGGRGRLIEIAAFFRGAYGIRRAMVSQKNLLEHLEILYGDWKGSKKLLQEYSEKGKNFVKGLTWEKTARQLVALFDKIENKEDRLWVKRNIIVKNIRLLMVIPSWGKNCGIAEYTKSLMEHLREENLDVKIYPAADPKDIINFATEHKLNVVHFQHEFSFWPEKSRLRTTLEELNAKNIKTVLTLHSFCKGLTSYNLMLAKRAGKIIVHAESFKKEFCAMESLEEKFRPDIDNVEFIPMGCDKPQMLNEKEVQETRKHLGISGRGPIVASFGFLREQKGYNDLLLAVRDLKIRYNKILCLIYAPPHEFGSKIYVEQFFKFIERENLQDLVLIVREYSKMEKMLRILQSADLFVLNYRDIPTGGGISAAVKTLMRTQRPIIVSDSIAFRDLKREVVKIQRPTVKMLSEAIEQVWRNEDLKRLLVEDANAFLRNNSWEKVAGEHLKIYGD